MPRRPDYQCHECGTLYERQSDAKGCCIGAKRAKQYMSSKQKPRQRLRFTCSLWSAAGAGFGVGVWRVVYENNFIVWTVAIGPLSVYLRYA